MKSYDKTSFIMNSFLIFEFPPLSYKYHLEINCETFGKTKDAEINQGFLFVMFENSDIQIFSLERILTEFGRKGSQFSDISEVNVDITEKPAVLFSVKSTDHYLQLSTFQPYCFLALQNDMIQTFDLKTGAKLNNGNISKRDMFEETEVFFHPDDSPRIIHNNGSKFRILKLEQDGPVEVFNQDASQQFASKFREIERRSQSQAVHLPSNDHIQPERIRIKHVPQSPDDFFPEYSTSGRVIRRSQNLHQLLLDLPDESSESEFGENCSVSFGYEFDLDLVQCYKTFLAINETYPREHSPSGEGSLYTWSPV